MASEGIWAINRLDGCTYLKTLEWTEKTFLGPYSYYYSIYCGCYTDKGTIWIEHANQINA